MKWLKQFYYLSQFVMQIMKSRMPGRHIIIAQVPEETCKLLVLFHDLHVMSSFKVLALVILLDLSHAQSIVKYKQN